MTAIDRLYRETGAEAQDKAYLALRRVLGPDLKARAIQARLDVERLNLECSDMLAGQDVERERFAARGKANG
jgi:hypothetical protein